MWPVSRRCGFEDDGSGDADRTVEGWWWLGSTALEAEECGSAALVGVERGREIERHMNLEAIGQLG